MIDAYGNWTYKPDTPAEKQCDYDIAAKIILEEYIPDIPVETLTMRIVEDALEEDDNMYGNDLMLDPQKFRNWLHDINIADYDYYA